MPAKCNSTKNRPGPGRPRSISTAADPVMRVQMNLPASQWHWLRATGNASATLRRLIDKAQARQPASASNYFPRFKPPAGK